MLQLSKNVNRKKSWINAVILYVSIAAALLAHNPDKSAIHT